MFSLSNSESAPNIVKTNLPWGVDVSMFSFKETNSITYPFKCKGHDTGLLIRFNNSFNKKIHSEELLFDSTYSGHFPGRATEPEIPKWILEEFNIPMKKERYSLKLQFGSCKINIGDISTGKVKSIIDCLYPLIGGNAGNPEDWRIDKISIVKEVEGLSDDMVRITLWGMNIEQDVT